MGTMFKRLFSVGVLTGVVLLSGTIAIPAWPQSSDLAGHRTSLSATVTMTDGTFRTITLEGVGCAQAMCSRVRIRPVEQDGVWLDQLASVDDISQNAEGPTHAVFAFRDGSSRETSITASNRMLYIGGRFSTHQIDLAHVRRIDFN
jgi:hypothetical protein